MDRGLGDWQAASGFDQAITWSRNEISQEPGNGVLSIRQSPESRRKFPESQAKQSPRVGDCLTQKMRSSREPGDERAMASFGARDLLSHLQSW